MGINNTGKNESNFFLILLFVTLLIIRHFSIKSDYDRQKPKQEKLIVKNDRAASTDDFQEHSSVINT